VAQLQTQYALCSPAVWVQLGIEVSPVLGPSVCLLSQGNDRHDCETVQYLNLMYRHTREAINRNEYGELVNACYLTSVHVFLARPYSEFIHHARGYLLSLMKFLEYSTDFGDTRMA
jgi:hypothetical protein